MRQEMLISRKSPFSNKWNSIQMRIDPADLKAWENGTLIQHAMPYLTPDEREFLMTGITADEWPAEDV